MIEDERRRWPVTTLLYAHPSFGAHEMPQGHPECAERYRVVAEALSAPEFEALSRRTPSEASVEMIERVHTERYFEALEMAAPSAELVRLDGDTFMGPSSLEAARRAAGAGCAAVDAIFAGEASNAFIAARPPGHHAMPERAMGFCLLSSAAIAARHARAVYGATRIAVVDFDVHHGNGTEAAFWYDADAFFASSHEFPQYPGTGRESDRGAFDNIFNAPLATGTGGDGFRRVWGERLLPALSDFRPDFVVISAGFDAHRADPLGGLLLVEEDFAAVTRDILAIAASACQGRVVSFLEGGYDLGALARSAAAHVKALMEA